MVIASLLTILLLYKCGCCGNKCVEIPKARIDTVNKTVTDTITTYVPKIVKITSHSIDTFIKYETTYLTIDTPKLIKDYFSVREYSDTQKIRYGKAVINDRIYMNRNIGRNLIIDQQIPEITKTVIEFKEVPEKKRNQIYAGISLISDSRQLIPGVSALFKNKRDNIIESGVYYNRNWWYQVGIKTKISFRK